MNALQNNGQRPVETDNSSKKKIAVLGDFNPGYHTHLALNRAIVHLVSAVHEEVIIEWVGTDTFDYSKELTSVYSGLWIASGSPYKDMKNVLNSIRFAREQNIPTYGNCGGYQHMIIEYARNICGLINADSEETNEGGDEWIISKLACSLEEQQEEISILKSSLLHSLIGNTHIPGLYHCNYGLNPAYASLLESKGMKMNARNSNGEIRGFEVMSHPFFIGTLFQPALTSTIAEPNPILLAFIQKCIA